MNLKKVILAIDNQLFRECLRSILENADGYEIIGEVSDGLEAIRLVKKVKPDLLIMDILLPRLNGISVLSEVSGKQPKMKTLVLTMNESEKYVEEAFLAGVQGYCLQDAGREELLLAVNSVMDDRIFISPAVGGAVIKGFLESRKKNGDECEWENVTRREREVLKLIAEDYNSKQIGEMLNISKKTVEKHRSNIMKKLKLHKTSELIDYAVRHGLVKPEV